MTYLDQIVTALRRDLVLREQKTSLEGLKRVGDRRPAPLDAVAALRNEGALSVIGEFKRRNLLGQPLAVKVDPAWFAKEVAAGGAQVISVVTQQAVAGGSLDDLRAVRAAVEIPVLYKEFVISPYQLHEAKAYGADLVLLVVSILKPNVLAGLLDRAHSLGMNAVVEVHSRLEALQALESGARIVGINAQDLRTLDVNMENFAQIVDVIPESVIAVAESGVVGPHDVFNYAQQGADAVLIGTAFMQAAQLRNTVKAMVAAGNHPALATSRKRRIRWVEQPN